MLKEKGLRGFQKTAKKEENFKLFIKHLSIRVRRD